jgi:hypothetical protein
MLEISRRGVWNILRVEYRQHQVAMDDEKHEKAEAEAQEVEMDEMEFRQSDVSQTRKASRVRAASQRLLPGD